MHPHVCDLFLLFATGFSVKLKIKSLWREKIKWLIDGITQGQKRNHEMGYYLVLGSRAQEGRGIIFQ